MDGQPEIVTKLSLWLQQAGDIAMGWLLSPAAWSQFALLVGAFIAARMITRRLQPALAPYLTPPEGKAGLTVTARLYLRRGLPLLLPLLAYAFTAMGEEVTRSLFGSGAVIAFGKRIFLFLAARIFVNEVLTDPFLRLLGRYVLIRSPSFLPSS